MDKGAVVGYKKYIGRREENCKEGGMEKEETMSRGRKDGKMWGDYRERCATRA